MFFATFVKGYGAIERGLAASDHQAFVGESFTAFHQRPCLAARSGTRRIRAIGTITGCEPSYRAQAAAGAVISLNLASQLPSSTGWNSINAVVIEPAAPAPRT